ncbi:hypothetical protein [Pseudomonas sp.]|uniref:hypothetical protein n=1 Tax=Pseudomonas sp. TaxID=306 RepID=UPI0025795259|nr:hypothetical protein [Pseudomonas sp.]
MNQVAQRALDRARDLAPKTAPIAPIKAVPPLPELVITGPINKFMYLEGKRYALDEVRAISTNPNAQQARALVRALTLTAAAKPASYAKGMKEVIDMLKGVL